jgi:DNA-binding CsgD family transcriptional regulator
MASRGRSPYPDILTPRQWEVLALLRQGFSDPQIAERLNISLAGAKCHVSEILARLDVATRDQAAAWTPPPKPRVPVLLGIAWKLAAAVAAASALVGVGLLAYAVLSHSGTPAADTQTLATRTSASNTAAATTLTGTSPTPLPPACTVDLPASWQDAFTRGEVGVPAGDEFLPIAVAPDGSEFLGDLYSDGWSGVAAVGAKGNIMQISQFAPITIDAPPSAVLNTPTENQIAEAQFDGRWLVWSDVPSSSDSGDLQAWDSTTGQVTDIGPAPAEFALDSGRLAWIDNLEGGTGPGDLHLYSLATGQSRLVSSAAGAPPLMFWNGDLMWNHLGNVEKIDFATEQEQAVPEPLTSFSVHDSVAASPNLVAWADGKSVFAWRPGDASAARIFTAAQGDQAAFVGIAGDLVTWGGVFNQWAAYLRSGSATKITESGFSVTNGSALASASRTVP